MHKPETFYKELKACSSAISTSVEAYQKNLTDTLQTRQQELLSRIDGCRGTVQEVTNRAEKMSSSILDIAGSIEKRVQSAAERLLERCFSVANLVGSTLAFGGIWRRFLPQIESTRREVTEELSCRTNVCPKCERDKT